jgi:hypothetical protein
MEGAYSNDYGWKKLYQAALLESDANRLPERISAARRAIFDRIEESLKDPLPSEHHAMNEALRHLRSLSETNPPLSAYFI